MSSDTKPVWVWLPDSKDPVLAGTFEVRQNSGGEVGYFSYDSGYLKHDRAFSLDPRKLKFSQTHPNKQYKSRLKGGLFGVFRDVCPEGYGRDLLNFRYGTVDGPLNEMDLLERSMGDSVGAIEICDDIEAKLASSSPPGSDILISALSSLSAERKASHAIHQIYDIGTSMGGERPKLTIEKGGELWLAKLQDRGDAPHMPAREMVAMRLATACGLTVSEVELFRSQNQHEALFVKRFDRVGVSGQRIPYMSAQTVLGLDIGILRGDPGRSYIVLADNARRIGVPDEDIRELWRRMAFNALINNVDDHPKNHGFIRIGDTWSLSPAFDIVPLLTLQPDVGPVLAMSVSKDGKQQAGIEQLIMSAPFFGLNVAESADWLLESARTIHERWLPDMLEAGVNKEFCQTRQYLSFQFAASIVNKPDLIDQSLKAAENASTRRRRRSALSHASDRRPKP